MAAAEQLGISTIVTCTQTGRTARLISEHRPAARVIACTPLVETYRRMAIYWGVTPCLIPPFRTTDEMLSSVTHVLTSQQICRRGEPVVLTSGIPNQAESTNMMTVHRL